MQCRKRPLLAHGKVEKNEGIMALEIWLSRILRDSDEGSRAHIDSIALP